jgi:hypothetical protein
LRRIKIGISLFFAAGIVAALAAQTFGYPPLLVKAKKFGAKDCTFCHVDPDGGPPWNERGQWLVKEKERRGADTIDVEWLANYKPGQVEAQKPADAAKTDDKKPADAAKPDDKKPAAPAGKPLMTTLASISFRNSIWFCLAKATSCSASLLVTPKKNYNPKMTDRSWSPM